MKIGELATRSGVAPSAIRFYEASGLLPGTSRGANGYRVYDDAALQKLLVIKLAQRLGFPLESLRAVLSDGADVPHELILARMRDRLAEIDALQARLRTQRRELQTLMAQLEHEWTQGNCVKLLPELDEPAPSRNVGARKRKTRVA